MDIKNNALIHNRELAEELTKRLPRAEIAREDAEAAALREEVAGILARSEAAPGSEPEFAGVALTTPHGPDITSEQHQPAKYINATKSPYNFQREKARRKAAKRSRRINRGK